MPSASRHVLLLMLYVRLSVLPAPPPVIVIPPPPCAAGKLSVRVLLLNTTSIATLASASVLKRSPGAEVNLQWSTVMFILVAAPEPGLPKKKLSLAPLLFAAGLIAPKVELVTVNRSMVPVLFTISTLSAQPPLIKQLSIKEVPSRLVTFTASSPELLPLDPLIVAYWKVKPVTLLPRMPKFWFVPLIVIRRSVIFVTLFKKMAIPCVLLPFAPLLFAIVPPVLLPPSVVLVPSPFTVKLPLVLFREIPLLVPPEVDTLVSAIARGVVPVVLLILIAVPDPVLMAPLVVVIVLLFSVAFKPV